LVFFFHI